MISKLSEAVNQNYRSTREAYHKMSFYEIIKEFNIPSELKTDLLYCQQNLKNFFQVHIVSISLERKEHFKFTKNLFLDFDRN